MTAVLERPAAPVAEAPHRHARTHGRMSDWLWVESLVALSAVVQIIGLGRTPQRVDDEGTYTAQAYAVQHFGELAHYTYWYDHPPLGWLQIAAWTTLTDAFDRVGPAVLAGREAVTVAHLVSVALLWFLARRMGLTRPFAAGAVLLYVLSPLAVTYHRMVYLDNVAMPWLLGAFVLAAARRHQLVAVAGAAMCFVVAVLSKETFVLLAPVLMWWTWQHSHPATRRYVLAVGGSLFAMFTLGYVVFATLKGELIAGDRHVSLADGVLFQLVRRQGSGSVLDPSSQAGDTVELWLRSDWVLPVLATVSALVIMIFVRRWRPIAAAWLLLLLLLLRPGYLPVPYVVAMLPFGALVVAAVIQASWSRAWLRAPTAVVVLLVAALAVPGWSAGLRSLWTSNADRPIAQAQAWLLAHLEDDDRVLVDDAIWVDLVQSGLPREQVVWYYKADTDPEVMAETPNGWRDYDYLLVTESVRESVALRGAGSGGPYPAVAEAYERSVTVASFGSSVGRVEVRQVGVAPPETRGGDDVRSATPDRVEVEDAAPAPEPDRVPVPSIAPFRPAQESTQAPEPDPAPTSPAPTAPEVEGDSGRPGFLSGLLRLLGGGS